MPGLRAGTTRPVVCAPDPVLSRPGRDVDPSQAATIQLVADLFATQLVSPGCVGLAAHQVGVAARVFSVDVSGHTKTRTCHGLFALCNAVVLSSARRQRGREGCMSVPDFTGDVTRGQRLVVRGQLPLTGQWVEITTDGFEAVALQHEIDHTNGLLFLDRVNGPRGIHPRRSYL
jgi:peptide deformylase